MKTPTQKHPGKVIRFPGIIDDARSLKVSRIHLYLVLSGQRTSHRLRRRYAALKKRKEGA